MPNDMKQFNISLRWILMNGIYQLVKYLLAWNQIEEGSEYRSMLLSKNLRGQWKRALRCQQKIWVGKASDGTVSIVNEKKRKELVGTEMEIKEYNGSGRNVIVISTQNTQKRKVIQIY